MGAFVTFWDNDEIHLLTNPGQDVRGQAGGQTSWSLRGHFHFLSVLAGTYDDIDIGRVRAKMPLSSVSTRSGALARFTFKGLDGTMTDLFIHLAGSGSQSRCSAWPPPGRAREDLDALDADVVGRQRVGAVRVPDAEGILMGSGSMKNVLLVSGADPRLGGEEAQQAGEVLHVCRCH